MEPIISLFDKETGTTLGTITEEQLQFLIDHLEEEGVEDQDYYIDKSTVDFLKAKVAAYAELMKLLSDALGAGEGMEIKWSR